MPEVQTVFAEYGDKYEASHLYFQFFLNSTFSPQKYSMLSLSMYAYLCECIIMKSGRAFTLMSHIQYMEIK